MSDFVYLFRIGEAAQRDAMGTPERAQKSMQRWMEWMGKLEADGHLKDRGQPLDRAGKVVRGKQRTVTDGPYVEAKEIIVSFTIIQADDYDAALAIARACPPGHTIEIREFAGYA